MPFNESLAPSVAQELAKKVIVPIIGPSGIGKSTVMQTICSLDDRFSHSTAFTTRPQRSNEPSDAYHFLPNTPEHYAQIRQDFEDGTIIQYVEHPTTGHIYGTYVTDYTNEYNMLATLSNTVGGFRSVGFVACRAVMLVATAAEWRHRFFARNMPEVEAEKRIAEGITSIEWGLGQGDAVAWITNANGKLTEASKQIISYSTGDEITQDNARYIAEQLLDALKAMEAQNVE